MTREYEMAREGLFFLLILKLRPVTAQQCVPPNHTQHMDKDFGISFERLDMMTGVNVI